MIRLAAAALRWVPETWAAVDAEAARERAARPGYDTHVAQIAVVASVILTFQWYWGDRPYFHEVLGKAVAAHPRFGNYLDLLAFSWWSLAKILGFLLVPMLHVRLLGARLRDFGMPGPGAQPPLPGSAAPGKWIYLLLFGGVLPLLVVVSFFGSFQSTYPLYRSAGRSWLDFLCWELQYGATFLSVEFFFRGYLLFGLRRALGSHAIFVMVIPYCMIHCLKPAAESLAAIVAGVVLGTLALSTRSIYYGVLIHVSVAWSMDLLAAAQTRGLPPIGRWLP